MFEFWSKGVKMMSKWLKIVSKGVKMPQNGPKWGQHGSKYGQNGPKSGQNVSTRPTSLKMAQNRPQMAQRRVTLSKGTETVTKYPAGHSGWHRFAAFGPPGAKFGPQKEPSCPICCQIWNAFGSIDGVFGSSARPWGSKGVKLAQNGSKWPKALSK